MASGYPALLDPLPADKNNGTDMTGDHPNHHNNLADAIKTVQATLGIEPAGEYATVAERLADLAPISSLLFTTMSSNAITASRALNASDAGKALDVNSADPVALTVPADATTDYPVGTVMYPHRLGAGSVQILPAGGVTIFGGGDTIIDQYSVAALRKIAANAWLLTGNVLDIEGTVTDLETAIAAVAADLVTEEGARAGVAADLATHDALDSAAAHGGVNEGDARLTNTRTPTDGTVTRAKLTADLLRTKRITTGAIASGAIAGVAVAWDTAFSDANYTVSALLAEETAVTSNTIACDRIAGIVAAGFTAVIRNFGTGTKTGVIHAIGIHD